MNIDPKTPICGVRPAVLKQLFRRGTITVRNAAAILELDPAEAASTLAALDAEGWLESHGDAWSVTDQGQQLLATPLYPRRSAQSAKAALERLLAEVAAINLDGSHAYLVVRVVAFGSILTAGPDDTVGDVDIAVQLRRRSDDDEAWSSEVATAPSSYSGVTRLLWPMERLLRRIRRVDRCISLHTLDEALSFGGKEIFNLADKPPAAEPGA